MQLPVNGSIVASFVCDFDNQSVAIVDFQGWTRILPIHRDDVAGFAQPLHWCCLNLSRQTYSQYLIIISTGRNKREIERERTYDKLMLVNFGL
jgi:hypothetical protein